jgi:serine/threonine-protein kinase
VVLYELLTGQRPFAGNSLEEIAEAVLRQPVPLAHEVNPEVPRALSEIVAQAMHRERDQRTRSARRLSQALRDWIERTDEPETPAEGRSATRPEQGSGVRRWLLPLAALGWGLALAGIGWAIWR